MQADVRDAAGRPAAPTAIDAVVHFAAAHPGRAVRRRAREVLPEGQRRRHARAPRGGAGDRRQEARAFVFSSTAAVYGNPARVPIDEDHPLVPHQPLRRHEARDRARSRAYGRATASAGPPSATSTPPARIARRASGSATSPRPTSSRSCSGPRARSSTHRRVRQRLGHARRHVRSRLHPRGRPRGGAPRRGRVPRGRRREPAFNLGTGAGHSVREVIRVVAEITGREVAWRDAPRRAGDPPSLVAAVDRAARVLGWRASRSDLRRIVRDAWSVSER